MKAARAGPMKTGKRKTHGKASYCLVVDLPAVGRVNVGEVGRVSDPRLGRIEVVLQGGEVHPHTPVSGDGEIRSNVNNLIAGTRLGHEAHD